VIGAGRMPWDTYFLQLAMLAGSRSKDPSTKVGAVIVGPDREIRSTGYNGFPRGVEDYPDRWERPEKYKWVVHAEANAVLAAARMGTSLLGCTLYMPYDAPPCMGCCAQIIQAGIEEVVVGHIPWPGIGSGLHYHVDSDAEMMLTEAGVLFRKVGPVV